jgi:hypothetical protein
MECCLGNGELMRLAGGQGLVLRCLKGTLWLTVGDGIDYLIYEGSSFKVGAGASAIVEALGAAEMRLESEPCQGATIRPIAPRQPCRAI